jgi:PAS domain S-box-containing protein
MANQVAQICISEGGGVEAIENRFFTLSLDIFLALGFDGYLKQMNPMCEKALGFTREELLAKPLIKLIHPKDREPTITKLEELATGGDNISYENRFRCKDGSYKWLLWNAAICPQEQLIYVAARDITERKQAEEALRQSEERFRLLVKNVKDYAIYMLDTSGRVISWNKGAEGINGYQAQEIIGQHFSCFFPSEEVSIGKPEEVLHKAASQGRCECETLRQRKDGSEFWANVVVTSLRDDNGFLRGFATVTRDITERKKAQEALQQAHDDLEKRVEERTAELQKANALLRREIAERQQAEEALRKTEASLRQQTQQLKQALRRLKRTQTQLIQTEKMSSLGQMVAGVAHEINNPVSFIYCNLDHASSYIQDLMKLLNMYGKYYPQPVGEIQAHIDDIDLNFLLADMPKLLSSMKLGAERIREIVLSLRNFSRHDQAEKKCVNIHEGIDGTLLILQHRLNATSSRGAIAVVKEYGDLPLVECYAGQLNQVFMNLLSNSIDALEEYRGARVSAEESVQAGMVTPTIKIRTSVKGGDRIFIRIADNGSGIKEDVLNRLFDPFFTTKPVGKGTGLGLSISHHVVVEKHGGQLTCVSSPGNGAEFLIEIPIKSRYQEPALLRSPSSYAAASSQAEVTAQQQLALG